MSEMSSTTLWHDEHQEVSAEAYCYDCLGGRSAKLKINSGSSNLGIIMPDLESLKELGDKIAAAIEWCEEEEREKAAKDCHMKQQLIVIVD